MRAGVQTYCRRGPHRTSRGDLPTDVPLPGVVLRAVLRERLAEIDAALARLDAGTHGTCEACGHPIAADRLAARPTARTCLGCATREVR